ncbi:MAG: hypothetical protein HN904_02700 [Victivallales bacterium]|nr:hypothetical protein [Victivallales bacterium]
MNRSALLLLSLSLRLAAAPAWQNAGPGGGGWIQSILASRHDVDELLVGCDVGGFYRSTNGGKSYTIQNRGLEDYYVECTVEHPFEANVLYLGCLSGVYKSTDRGQSWQWLRNGFPPIQGYSWSAPVGALAIDPEDADTLYAGIGSPRRQKWGAGAIYKTTDGGKAWRQINAPGSLPKDALVSSIAIHPEDTSNLLIATQRGVYRSLDGGRTWQDSNQGLPHTRIRRLALCPGRPDTVYLTIASRSGVEPWQGGVYKSTDGGKTWAARSHGLAQSVRAGSKSVNLTSWYDCLAVHPQDPDIAYVGGAGWVNAALYQTIDGGKNWRNVTLRGEGGNLPTGWITMWGPTVKCLSMSRLDPSTLYFGTSGMVYRTRDAGGTWEQVYSRQLPDGRIQGAGLEVTCLHNVMPDPNVPDRVFFGFFDIGLMRSDDAGKTFRRGVEGVSPHSMANSCFDLAFDAAKPERIWGAFGQWGANQGVLATSQDGGLTWTMLAKDSGLPNARCRQLILRDGMLYGALDSHGVYLSRDQGVTWQASNQGLPTKAIRSLRAVPGKKGSFLCVLGFTGQKLGGIYRSDNGCRTWRKVSGDFPIGDVKNLQVALTNPQRLYLAMRDRNVGKVPVPGGVYRSDDGGKTWQQILRNHFAQSLAVHPSQPDTVLAGLNDHPYHDQSTGDGVLGSRDGGRTWYSLNDGTLTVRQITALRFDPLRPTRVFAGTGGNAAFITELTDEVWKSLAQVKNTP